MTTTQAPAGWYPDPAGRHPERQWDGRQWTAAVRTEAGEGTDPLGPPVFGLPPSPPTNPANRSAWVREHRTLLAVAAAIVVVLALVGGAIAAIDNRIDDARHDIAAEQKRKLDKTVKDQNAALSDAADQIDDTQSQLSDLQDEMSDLEGGIGEFDPSQGFPGGATSDPCSLVTPGDVAFILGQTVAVHPEAGVDDFECVLSTDLSPTGMSVLVYSDSLLGDKLGDVVFPLASETLQPLAAGDQALGSVAFGVAHGAAAKDGLYVEIIVTGGPNPLSLDQLQNLLTVAVTRLH